MSTEENHGLGQDAEKQAEPVADTAPPETFKDDPEAVKSDDDGSAMANEQPVDVEPEVDPSPDPEGDVAPDPATDTEVNQRLVGKTTDRDVLAALADGSITRADAREWLSANPDTD